MLNKLIVTAVACLGFMICNNVYAAFGEGLDTLNLTDVIIEFTQGSAVEVSCAGHNTVIKDAASAGAEGFNAGSTALNTYNYPNINCASWTDGLYACPGTSALFTGGAIDMYQYGPALYTKLTAADGLETAQSSIVLFIPASTTGDYFGYISTTGGTAITDATLGGYSNLFGQTFTADTLGQINTNLQLDTQLGDFVGDLAQYADMDNIYDVYYNIWYDDYLHDTNCP